MVGGGRHEHMDMDMDMGRLHGDTGCHGRVPRRPLGVGAEGETGNANRVVGGGWAVVRVVVTLSCAVTESSWLVGAMMAAPVAEGAPARAKELCVVSQE